MDGRVRCVGDEGNPAGQRGVAVVGEQAEAALGIAEKLLGTLGVRLNRQKTQIVHVRQGFAFLGYKIKRGSRSLRHCRRRPPPTLDTEGRRMKVDGWAKRGEEKP